VSESSFSKAVEPWRGVWEKVFPFFDEQDVFEKSGSKEEWFFKLRGEEDLR